MTRFHLEGEYMLLALDIGNSEISVAINNNDNWIKKHRILSDKNKGIDFYKSELVHTLKKLDINSAEIDSVVIASVVPNLKSVLKLAAQEIFKSDIFVVEYNSPCGLKINIDEPNTLGVDLLCACVATAKHYRLPAVVFDFGSATTMCVIDKNNCFQGGVILPGIKTSLDALTKKCELISEIDISKAKSLIAKNTVDCINSGICYSNAATVDKLSEKVENELNESCTVILTGGLSSYVAPYCNKDVLKSPDLVIEGMKLIFEYNSNL